MAALDYPQRISQFLAGAPVPIRQRQGVLRKSASARETNLPLRFSGHERLHDAACRLGRIH